MPIEQVPDQVFAEKLVGDGIGIDPTNNILTAPCAGKIVQLHQSHHAVTIETEFGGQILLHIGIDTVNLRGEGFQALVKIGDQVIEGQELIKFDPDLIATRGMSLVSVMVLIEGSTQNKLAYKFSTESKTESNHTVLASLRIEESANNSPLNQDLKIDDAFESVPFYIRMPSGMHARPAAKLAELSKKYDCSLELINKGKAASVNSIISVLGLEIEKDDEIIILAIGRDCQKAVRETLALLVQIEEEELENFKKESKEKPKQKLIEIKSDERTFVGVSASNGVVVGKVSILKEESFDYPKTSDDLDKERLLLENSILSACDDLQKIEQKLGVDQKEKVAIFSAHREMLSDPDLIEECVVHINQGKTAAYSWDLTTLERASRLESLKNELIAGRANDIRDIGKRVLKKILGIVESKNELDENIILIAEDLTPTDTIQLDKSKVLGFCTTSGGATSHVAILARSMGIPAIAGIEKRTLELKNGAEVILDGDLGALYLEPTSEEKAKVKIRQEQLEGKKKAALSTAKESATTRDGHQVEVVANISGISDAQRAVELGGEGVGLLRTEFLFLERENAPTEKEQQEIYQGIVDALGERPLVIRTLDIGGDKSVNYLPMEKEENPFLGIRGIRLCFQREDLFRTQLRAILKVKSEKPIHIMFPMIGQLSELRLAKKIVEEERLALKAKNPKIGIMIEVPSAAVMAEQFAKEVDFFSIGTNDLTQYTLAMDRGHNELAKQVDGLHPSVLALIKMTVDAAHKHGKWVGVCGGIASELKALPVLLALGVDELSLSIPNIPMIKAAVRELELKDCKSLCQEFLAAESGKEVREIVINKWPHLI